MKYDVKDFTSAPGVTIAQVKNEKELIRKLSK